MLASPLPLRIAGDILYLIKKKKKKQRKTKRAVKSIGVTCKSTS